MQIFNTIQELKAHVSGGANVSIDIKSLLSSIKHAATNHLIPWIGQDLADDIETKYQEDVLSANEKILLAYLQSVLGPLTMYEYAKIGAIQFSDSGMHRVENDHHKSAYKYQENQYKDYMLENGYEQLENLMVFLQKTKDTYVIWRDSEVYDKNLELTINYAREFWRYTDRSIKRYTFEMIRPIIGDIECFTLPPYMGDDQFDDIKTKIAAEITLSPIESGLLKLMQKIVSEFTLEESTRRNIVRLDGRNVIQSEKLEPQSYEKTSTPSASLLKMKLNHHDSWGNRFITKLIKYLEKNRTDFPLYDTWKTEQETEEAAALAEESKCEADQDRPYDTTRCQCGEFCTCQSSGGNAVIGL